MPETKVGHVKEYFAKVGVAGIEITEGHLLVGDTIHVKGHTTDLTQRVDSIQLEHQPLQRAGPPARSGLQGNRVKTIPRSNAFALDYGEAGNRPLRLASF